MTLIIDGVDIMPFIEHQGIKRSRKDINGPNAGSAINGRTWRDRITRKTHLDISCMPLNNTDAKTVLDAIAPEYVTVTYDDPQLGTRTCTMYSENEPAAVCMDIDGEDRWIGIAFPLEEV